MISSVSVWGDRRDFLKMGLIEGKSKNWMDAMVLIVNWFFLLLKLNTASFVFRNIVQPLIFENKMLI